MKFDEIMADLRKHLQQNYDVKLVTEELLKELEKAHYKALPKPKKKASVFAKAPKFRVTITEREKVTSATFDSEKALDSFLKLKAKTRQQSIDKELGKPDPRAAANYRSQNRDGDYYTSLVDDRKAEIITKFGDLNIKIETL